MSSLPLNAYLTVKIAESGKSNTEIADALGYPRPNVVAMLKTGSMRLPLNKVSAMAKVLEIDKIFLLEKVMTESTPEMWEALKAIIGPNLISQAELKLVEFVRGELDGADVDVTASPEFTEGAKVVLKGLRERYLAETQATLERIERERHAKKAA